MNNRLFFCGFDCALTISFLAATVCTGHAPASCSRAQVPPMQRCFVQASSSAQSASTRHAGPTTGGWVLVVVVGGVVVVAAG
jgi:hypothetical protein